MGQKNMSRYGIFCHHNSESCIKSAECARRSYLFFSSRCISWHWPNHSPKESAEMSSPCIFLGSSPILFYILYSILFLKIDTLTSLKRPDKFIWHISEPAGSNTEFEIFNYFNHSAIRGKRLLLLFFCLCLEPII